MWNVIRSLLIIIAVSTAFAAFLTNFSISFWSAFVFVTTLQFICWYTFMYIVKIKAVTAIGEVERQIAEEMSKQQAPVPCAHCDHVNIISIRLDEDNSFDCEACNKKNSVYVDIEAAATARTIDEG